MVENQAMSSLALCEAAKKFFAASIFSQPPVALAWNYTPEI